MKTKIKGEKLISIGQGQIIPRASVKLSDEHIFIWTRKMRSGAGVVVWLLFKRVSPGNWDIKWNRLPTKRDLAEVKSWKPWKEIFGDILPRDAWKNSYEEMLPPI